MHDRHHRSSPRPSAFTPAVALAILAAVAFVYWPGIHGFWGRDDYFQLAFARLIGSPFPLFVQDHYPVPGSVFRPLGFVSMWLCERLFGSNYTAHALVDLGLHAGVALALFGVLRRAAIPALPAVLATLLFALHPAVIGTALWWSARFDLLATLFILLALQAGMAYRNLPRAAALCAALGAAMAAMLCKEIGLVAVAALSLLWLHWAWREPAMRARALCAVALACATAVAWLGWRWAVLGTASSGLTGELPIVDAIVAGLRGWLQQAPGYLSFWARLDPWQRIAAGIALAVLGLLALQSLRRLRSPPHKSTDLLLCGLCLLLLPALLQAPVAALNAQPLRLDVSAIETAMQSRLYYLGIAGAVLALAPLLARLWDAPGWLRMVAGVSMLAILTVFATASREAAQAFAQRSYAIAQPARDAVAAVANLDLPATQCHLVFLDVTSPPEWATYVSMDSQIKALSPDLDKIGHCWIHADQATWFHLLAAPVTAADAAPFRPLQVEGRELPWPEVGGLVIAYLEPAATTSMPASTIFLQQRNGHFEEVRVADAAGRWPVLLQ